MQGASAHNNVAEKCTFRNTLPQQSTLIGVSVRHTHTHTHVCVWKFTALAFICSTSPVYLYHPSSPLLLPRHAFQVAGGFVVGYRNESPEAFDLCLDFSGSTNVSVASRFGAERAGGSGLVCRQVCTPPPLAAALRTSLGATCPFFLAA